MMLFTMRVSILDEPGALGALATALGRAGSNIVTLDVVEYRDGIAVDDLCVEVKDEATLSDGLRRAAEDVRGAVVEAIKPLRAHQRTSPMHLAASVAGASPSDSLAVLIEGLPDAMWASWAVALRSGSPPHVMAASAGAPSMSNIDTPWLPLETPRALAPAPWMPPAWCMGRMSYEIAAAPLEDPENALLIARRHGPRFRPAELDQLGLLARIYESSSPKTTASLV
jgi:hypothetical protein